MTYSKDQYMKYHPKSLTGSLCSHVVPLKVVHRDTVLTTAIDVSSHLLGIFTIATIASDHYSHNLFFI